MRNLIIINPTKIVGCYRTFGRSGYDEYVFAARDYAGVAVSVALLTVAIAVTFFIYRSTGVVYQTSFYLPWGAVAVAVGAVFAVVIASMLYAWSKLRKDNPIDALRSENI